MTPKAALGFVERHGVVLQAARGPVPSLAETVAGGPIRGSWWGHPKGKEIFRAAQVICESPEVLVSQVLSAGDRRVRRPRRANHQAALSAELGEAHQQGVPRRPVRLERLKIVACITDELSIRRILD